ncbi:hypothetical protein [Congregicoccus parvus]
MIVLVFPLAALVVAALGWAMDRLAALVVPERTRVNPSKRA